MTIRWQFARSIISVSSSHINPQMRGCDFLPGFWELAFRDTKIQPIAHVRIGETHLWPCVCNSTLQNATRRARERERESSALFQSRAQVRGARACAYLPSTYMYFSGLWGWEVCQPQGVMLASYSWHLCFVLLRRRRRHRSPSRPRRIRSLALPPHIMCFAKRNSSNCCFSLSRDAHCGLTQFFRVRDWICISIPFNFHSKPLCFYLMFIDFCVWQCLVLEIIGINRGNQPRDLKISGPYKVESLMLLAYYFYFIRVECIFFIHNAIFSASYDA
jgi:hypothetical protein